MEFAINWDFWALLSIFLVALGCILMMVGEHYERLELRMKEKKEKDDGESDDVFAMETGGLGYYAGGGMGLHAQHAHNSPPPLNIKLHDYMPAPGPLHQHPPPSDNTIRRRGTYGGSTQAHGGGASSAASPISYTAEGSPHISSAALPRPFGASYSAQASPQPPRGAYRAQINSYGRVDFAAIASMEQEEEGLVPPPLSPPRSQPLRPPTATSAFTSPSHPHAHNGTTTPRTQQRVHPHGPPQQHQYASPSAHRPGPTFQRHSSASSPTAQAMHQQTPPPAAPALPPPPPLPPSDPPSRGAYHHHQQQQPQQPQTVVRGADHAFSLQRQSFQPLAQPQQQQQQQGTVVQRAYSQTRLGPSPAPPHQHTPQQDPQQHQQQQEGQIHEQKHMWVPNLEIDPSELVLNTVIGSGGFGEVWRGLWRGTPVAVKTLPSLTADKGSPSRASLQNFQAEVSMLASLRHPNICLFLGACLQPSNRAIVTELVSRGSLWDVLRQPLHGASSAAAQWPMSLIHKVAHGTACGMNYLHHNEPPIIHRDLKSANILLDDSFNPKICDFGLARLKAFTNTMTGECGTSQWMAPEVLANARYSELADVYSFGIVCWELLTRQCPYEGMPSVQVGVAVLTKGIRPPLPRDCPVDLAKLICRCWAQIPSHRPSFAQVLEDLNRMQWTPESSASGASGGSVAGGSNGSAHESPHQTKLQAPPLHVANRYGLQPQPPSPLQPAPPPPPPQQPYQLQQRHHAGLLNTVRER